MAAQSLHVTLLPASQPAQIGHTGPCQTSLVSIKSQAGSVTLVASILPVASSDRATATSASRPLTTP